MMPLIIRTREVTGSIKRAGRGALSVHPLLVPDRLRRKGSKHKGTLQSDAADGKPDTLACKENFPERSRVPFTTSR